MCLCEREGERTRDIERGREKEREFEGDREKAVERKRENESLKCDGSNTMEKKPGRRRQRR